MAKEEITRDYPAKVFVRASRCGEKLFYDVRERVEEFSVDGPVAIFELVAVRRLEIKITHEVKNYL
jgi:hypothetical protein